MHSALYEGWVRHRRYAPVGNQFRYRHAMLYLDLAELPTLFRRTALHAYGRPNLAWFRRADYLGPPDVPLDTAVRDRVAHETGRRPAGPIRMLTQLRTLGVLFNPVTFYYCFDAAGEQVEAVVAEITNTPWLERHAYVLPRRRSQGRGAALHVRFPKVFHVSPFLPMEIEHDWRFAPPGAQIRVHMEDVQEGRVVLDATLALRRKPLARHTLTWALVRHPLRTIQVPLAIYVQALRLWWKRVPFFPHPDRARREKGDPDVSATLSAPPSAGSHPTPGAGTTPRSRAPARHHGRQPVDS